MDQCGQIQIVSPLFSAGSSLGFQHVRRVIQDPSGFIVAFLCDQKLCLEQSRRHILLIHGHHALHQFAGLREPGSRTDLFQSRFFIIFHDLGDALHMTMIRMPGHCTVSQLYHDGDLQ